MKNCLKGFALFHLRKFPRLGQLPRENLSKTFKSKCIRCCFLTNSWGTRGGNTTYGCGTPNTAGGANGLVGGTAFTAPAVWPLHFQTLARVLSFEERMQVSRAG